jgi:hypothetical protein
MQFNTGPGTFTLSPLGNFDGYVHKINDCGVPPSPVNITPINSLGICAQTNATLNVTGLGTINWYSSASSTNAIGSGSAFITPTLSVGVYTYYASATTCTTNPIRTAITLTVDNPPIISINTSSALICAGVTVAITANGASTYSWNNGGTGSVIVVMPVLSTVFIVTGYNGSCASTASIVQNVAWCSGIDELENDVKLTLSPNPNMGEVKVESDTEISAYKISDLAGKLLIDKVNINSKSLNLDLFHLQNSVYIIQIRLSDGRVVERKVIIQK